MGTRQNRLVEAVLTSTHNLCFKQIYKIYQFFEVKFSICLNRRVFAVHSHL